MELSETELKLLSKLEKRNASWRVHKWVILLNSFLILFIYYSTAFEESLLLAGGVFGIVYSLTNWEGRAESLLLLKVLKHQAIYRAPNT